MDKKYELLTKPVEPGGKTGFLAPLRRATAWHQCHEETISKIAKNTAGALIAFTAVGSIMVGVLARMGNPVAKGFVEASCYFTGTPQNPGSAFCAATFRKYAKPTPRPLAGDAARVGCTTAESPVAAQGSTAAAKPQAPTP